MAISLQIGFNSSVNASSQSPSIPNSDSSADPNEQQPYAPSLLEAAAIVVLGVLIAAGTTFGNALLLLAIAIVRRLHQPCNILICSLASSNLLIALTVEPFVAYKGVSQEGWGLGPLVCRATLFLDGMLCTASMLNLLAITVDMYLLITRPLQYTPRRTTRLMLLMVGAVWLVAAAVPASAYLWPHHPLELSHCAYTAENIGFLVHATATLLIPLLALAALWVAILVVARRIVSTDRSRTFSIYKKKKRLWRWKGRENTSGASPASTSINNVTRDNNISTMHFTKASENRKMSSQEKTPTATTGSEHNSSYATTQRVEADGCVNVARGQCPKNEINGNLRDSSAKVRGHSNLPPLSDRFVPGNPPAQNEFSCALQNGAAHGAAYKSAPLLDPASKSSRSPSPAAAGAERDRIPPNRSKSALIPATTTPKAGTATALVMRAQSVASGVQARKLVQNGNVGGGVRRKSKKDNKALITVAAIMGSFAVCWLPYFIYTFVSPLYEVIFRTSRVFGFLTEQADFYVSTIILWLSYVHNLLNPLIFGKFNRDFRLAFSELVRCRCRRVNSRLRAENYSEIFGGRDTAIAGSTLKLDAFGNPSLGWRSRRPTATVL